MSGLSFKSLSVLSFGCAAAAIALAGCDKAPPGQTGITFRQIGVCKGFETASGKVTAPNGQAFAVFKVQELDNSKTAKGFLFDPANLYVDQSNATQKAGKVGDLNRRFSAPDTRLTQTTGAAKLDKVTVPSGEKKSVDGVTYTAIETNNPTGGPDAKQFDLSLLYDDWTSEKVYTPEGWVSQVVLTKLNPSDTFTVVEDCKSLPIK
ncbi:hypothetical protein [Methylocapsa palsarum]|uniref:Lipoprotein n=1 Tax=Methylocapsa palsarum TaxID=1612308 RepID=A0A1I3Y645_9HYPH|nr:hypothetical protein [Methylocapsa palsarum]SFK27447.1 hypothetical protein SAMN05444581_10543 [Methylocapsa palsarum]